jgi:hypothetical protein
MRSRGEGAVEMLVLHDDAWHELCVVPRTQPIGENAAVAPNRDRAVGGLTDEGGPAA